VDTRCNYYNQSYQWRKAVNFCMKKDGEICLVAPGSPRCWAVSSSDTAPALWSLGASVRLAGPAGERTIPISALYQDDGIQYLSKRADEILTEVVLPPAEGWRSAYLKLRRRGAFDFPILGVAAAVLQYRVSPYRHPAPLADAQRAKYRRIAEGAGLREGMHVLEIGSGWGGFALHAAREFGSRVTTITISREQFELASARVLEAGLEELIDVRLCDYRDVTGRYDAVVSIEMLEAVGAEYFGTFFEVCDRALVPGGRLSLQVITFPDAAYERQLRGANWIQTYIFPGGLCPSLAVIERSTGDTGLLIRSVTDIASSYVHTLRAWRERFLARADAVRALGFDERFMRTWEYYLALSEAGFATGISQDLQIVFEKSRGMTRAAG